MLLRMAFIKYIYVKFDMYFSTMFIPYFHGVWSIFYQGPGFSGLRFLGSEPRIFRVRVRGLGPGLKSD